MGEGAAPTQLAAAVPSRRFTHTLPSLIKPDVEQVALSALGWDKLASLAPAADLRAALSNLIGAPRNPKIET